jgi:hypothetical protein
MLSKVPNDKLLEAGLAAMERSGIPLKRVDAPGRAKVFSAPNGRTVRVRTCNDHVLVAVAESPDEGAPLNIEGTDDLLIVMPKVPRTPGEVIVFLVPTKVAVEAVRSTHKEWLATNPSTKGKNRTWNIWFNEDGPSKANGFARAWAKYVLNSNELATERLLQPANGSARLGDVIADAKRKISEVAGVPESSVKISIDLT